MPPTCCRGQSRQNSFSAQAQLSTHCQAALLAPSRRDLTPGRMTGESRMTKTPPHARGSEPEVWRVGVLFSRSGLMAITESEHFFGTALAIEEVNRAGGVVDREIGVVAEEPGCD